MSLDLPTLRGRSFDYEMAPADERRNARVPVKLAAAGRVCEHPTCGTILRSTVAPNDTGYCSLHQDYVPPRPYERSGYRERRSARATGRVPKTRAGSKTAEILEAMPGKASEIAEKIGDQPRTVRFICNKLVEDGRAYRQRVSRQGWNAEQTVYVKAPA